MCINNVKLVILLVIPNETATIHVDVFGSTGSNKTLPPMYVALIVVMGIMVVIFSVVLFAMKRRLDAKSRNMQSATYDNTAPLEEVYDFVNENLVCITLYIVFPEIIEKNIA